MARPALTSARLLIGLLLVATVLVDLVASSIAVTYCRSPQGWPQPPLLVVVWALALSQVSLVAIWTGFGGRSLPWRIMGLVATSILWSRLIAVVECAGPFATVPSITHKEIASDWSILSFAQTVPILICLSIARAVGVRLAATREVDAVRQPPSGHPRLQFSLSYLFSWTVALGASLGLIQWTVDYDHLRGYEWFVWADYGIMTVAEAGLALAAFWAALGTRWPAVRILVLCLTTAAAILSWKLHTMHVRFPSVPVTLCFLQVLWLLGSLWVIRVAGYRLVRRASSLR